MSGIDTFRELKPNKLTQKLLTYIGDTFPLFTQSDEFENILKKKKNEPQHSKALCVFMTNYCKAKYNFQGENAQWGSHTIDIGVYKGAVLIFVIEAKLLPTPKGSKQSPRFEYEYVYGKGSGIQRFKEGKHGVDNENISFADCGMIAFVKENEFDFWHKKVNQWVLDAKWESDEQLQKIKTDEIATFLSAHKREDDSNVRLHHFWVKV